MKLLVLNCGSSSIKYSLYEMPEEETVADGKIERINEEKSLIEHSFKDNKITIEDKVDGHASALQKLMDLFTHTKYGVLNSLDQIDAVGHRVVHGGEKFTESTLIDEDVIERLKELSKLAPLHNPHNVKGIEACKNILNDIEQVAVFDTSFHQSMEQQAYLYAIPYRYYEENDIRKYGFHGTSHRYVTNEAAKFVDEDIEDLNIVSCHLGNGASLAAVKNGQSIDTSMGFTPLEGLIMGTRSGDLDPSIVSHIAEVENVDCSDVEDILNEESGLLGISGVSNDFRDIKEAASEGNQRALLAINMFIYRLKKYVGAYAAAMNGLDLIVFTGGIGENSHLVRKGVLKGLNYLGTKIDTDKNKGTKSEKELITSKNSDVQAVVIPTDEELMIARDTHRILNN